MEESLSLHCNKGGIVSKMMGDTALEKHKQKQLRPTKFTSRTLLIFSNAQNTYLWFAATEIGSYWNWTLVSEKPFIPRSLKNLLTIIISAEECFIGKQSFMYWILRLSCKNMHPSVFLHGYLDGTIYVLVI